MIIVCPTVPHTGTHFMRKLFEGADVELVLVHPYPDQVPELSALVDAGNPCVIPQRRSDLVRASWIKYGKDLNDYAGMSFEQWYKAMQSIADRTVTYYLQIDIPGIRDMQLAEINRELGLELVTDWEPVRQSAA